MEQSRLDEEKTEDHAEDNPALNKVIAYIPQVGWTGS